MLLEDIVGHLVLATRRPVHLGLTREEEFVSSRIRHAQTLTFRTGVDREGRLLAQDLHVVGNTGAYATHGFTVQSVTGQRGVLAVQLPGEALHVRRRLHEPAGGRRLPRLRRTAGVLRARESTWTTSPGPRPRPGRVPPEELGRHRRPARHPAGARRARCRGGRARGHPAHHHLRHRGVRGAGRCARSSGSAVSTRSGSNRRTGRTSGAGSGSRCACRRRASPTSTWAARRSR